MAVAVGEPFASGVAGSGVPVRVGEGRTQPVSSNILPSRATMIRFKFIKASRSVQSDNMMHDLCPIMHKFGILMFHVKQS